MATSLSSLTDGWCKDTRSRIKKLPALVGASSEPKMLPSKHVSTPSASSMPVNQAGAAELAIAGLERLVKAGGSLVTISDQG